MSPNPFAVPMVMTFGSDPIHLQIFRRDLWTCQYCDLDGGTSFAAWRSLSLDHLLPRGHRQRELAEFIVTACQPCNTMLNCFPHSLETPSMTFSTSDASVLVLKRKKYLTPRLKEWEEDWKVATGSE